MNVFQRVIEVMDVIATVAPMGRRSHRRRSLTEDEYDDADNMSSILMYVVGFLGLALLVFWLTHSSEPSTRPSPTRPSAAAPDTSAPNNEKTGIVIQPASASP